MRKSLFGLFSFLTLSLCTIVTGWAQPTYQTWGSPPPAPVFPHAPLPSVHIYEAGGLSPNIGLHLRDQTLGLLGVSQWGIANTPSTYSGFATQKDVVLNAVEAEDLIITNLSGSKHTTTDVGAIRFGTAVADGSGTVPADIERMTILNNGNVGVNQNLPDAKFQVTNGSVLFDGGSGATPVSGAGTRFMWVPEKSALRAGDVISDKWDDINIGHTSIGLGFDNKASGSYSVVLGYQNEASGNESIAIGSRAEALGILSLALGQNSSASGNGAIALTNHGEANGTLSTAIGLQSIANGISSIAIGALGEANGYSSVALGRSARTEGKYSIAISNNHATAEAYASTVVGYYNITDPTYSQSTSVDTDPLFVIGNGLDENNRSNALTILKNSNVGIGNHTPTTTRLLVKGSGTTDATTALDVQDANGSSLLYVGDDGFVGIGTAPCLNETFKFKVDGHLKAKEVVVEVASSGWCDYVFDDDYELTSLEKLEKEINDLGHLPGIPSSAEVEEQGVNLSEMQAKLLLKVEELTLYTIEQEKRLKKLEAENQSLRQLIEKE